MTVQPEAKGRILIVDDADEVRETIGALLAESFHTFFASNGIEALEFLKTNEVDVILLDENMPRMGGHLCFTTLRDMGNDTPVIFCTGKPGDDLKMRELNHGAFDYISKPIHADVLIALAQEAYKNAGRIRSKKAQKLAV